MILSDRVTGAEAQAEARSHPRWPGSCRKATFTRPCAARTWLPGS